MKYGKITKLDFSFNFASVTSQLLSWPSNAELQHIDEKCTEKTKDSG